MRTRGLRQAHTRTRVMQTASRVTGLALPTQKWPALRDLRCRVANVEQKLWLNSGKTLEWRRGNWITHNGAHDRSGPLGISDPQAQSSYA
jgi:hypothetical protein